MLSVSAFGLMAQAPVIGTWKLTFIGVGPSKGDVGWYNTGISESSRACLADDEYVFNADGSFENKMGTETWLENWQGAAADGCGAPVAPHDGANKGSWTYDETAGKVTIVGKGNFLGLAKVVNGAELSTPSAAPDSITYEVGISGNDMTVDINFGGGYWRYTLKKEAQEEPIITNPEGTWNMVFMGVGPNKGDVSWYNTALNDATRPCLADDQYVFAANGSFQNVLGDQTWLEAWQGAAEGCGTPVAPHDGSNTGSWMDNKNGTITVKGKGNYLGLSKVYNGGEIKAPSEAKDEITYEVVVTNDTLIADIAILTGDGTPAYWHFRFLKQQPNAAKAINTLATQIFPNPAQDRLWISNAQGATVKILSVDGRTLREMTIENNSIAVDFLQVGAYVLEVKVGSETQTHKFIKN